MTLALGLACARIPTAPARQVDLEFVFLDREGDPIRGADIILENQGSSRALFIEETDASGFAKFRVPEGRYSGTAYNRGEAPYPSDWSIPEFIVSETSPKHVVRLSGAYVTGALLDPGGATLNSGYVAMSGRTLDGNYTDLFFPYTGSTFRALVPPGTYDIAAFGITYPSPYPAVQINEVPIGNDTTLVFHLAGSRVEGRVTGRGGVPIAGARVYANGLNTYATGWSDATGGYFLYLPNDSYRWTVTPPDSMRYVLNRLFPSTVITGPAVRDFSLDGAYWSGTAVLEGTGAPLTGGYVSASPWGATGRSAYSLIAADGSFLLILERGLEYDLYVQDYSNGFFGRFRTGIADADSVLTLDIVPPSSAGRALTSGR